MCVCVCMYVYVIILFNIRSKCNILKNNNRKFRPKVRADCKQSIFLICCFLNSAQYLWSHVIMAIVYLIICGAFMLNYSLKLGHHQNIYVSLETSRKQREEESLCRCFVILQSTQTVQIQYIPKLVHVEDLMQHLE